jgi:murein DD-endopeptidase MepM/ murein hydrolase activator NlpD
VKQLLLTVTAFSFTPTPTPTPNTDLPEPGEYTGKFCAPAGWPVRGRLTQKFGDGHTGIDVSGPRGSPVYATHSAIVIWAGWSSDGYGKLVVLQSGPYITYYAHLSSVEVVVRSPVNRGSLIGLSGSTGRSTGPHVHYETRIDNAPVDPLTFKSRGDPSC